MVVTYWCVRAEPLDMKVHSGVDLPGQEPDSRRGHVNSQRRFSLGIPVDV